MPRGKPKNGLWRNREPLTDWLARQEPRPCACGCGQMVIPKKAHRHRGGLPMFIWGHHVRVTHCNYKGVELWVAAEQGKHVCACGCGGLITILPRHHCSGIPRYLRNHSFPALLGTGSAHPRFIQDRTLVRTRGGKYFTPATMKEISRRCGGRCVRCGASSELEHDHIVPIFAGGGAEASNRQLLCIDCHKLKSQFERALSRPAEGIRRFVRSLIAFIEFAEEEVRRDGCDRNTA